MILYNCIQNFKGYFYIGKGGNNIKAGLYARVSTDSQVEGYSIDAQKELLENYARAKEYKEYKFYIDPGFSGKNLERPAIGKLMNDVKNGEIDTVIVYKLDRISRSQKDTLYLIEEIFNKYNVGFISIRESFDTTTPFGKAMIGILSVFAQLERETILERTRMGIQKRAEAGYWRGGGKIPFGYDYNKELGTLVPNSNQKEMFDKMVRLYLSGYSFNKISSVVGIDESMIERIILSKTNLGYVPYKGELFQGKHEPLITESTYQEILDINKLRSKGRTARHYLLSGKIYCGHCGAKYRYQKWGKRIICYCYSQQKSKPKFIKDPDCKNAKVDSFEIEDAVLEEVFKMSLDQNLFETNFTHLSVNIVDELQERVDTLSTRIKNLINFIAQGVAVKETQVNITELEKERAELIEKLQDAKASVLKKENTIKMITSLKDVWQLMPFEEKRLVLELLIDRITIDNNNLTIKYKFS